ncbi:hypothetical protein THRCLA_22710 [Thraustotheca clavata]|uniref:F-box domain-containing protein n=1 Tax=Thraustotheca clavata TaxID=74557 RepID=A0A1V9YUF4_9STRA|nr:hypothetical protein THRCLA_22710 [Thraustotheca clavata]
MSIPFTTFLSKTLTSVGLNSRRKQSLDGKKNTRCVKVLTKIAAILLQYLDALSICRLQRACWMWRREILDMEDTSLWTKLMILRFGEQQVVVYCIPSRLSFVTLLSKYGADEHNNNL